VPVGVARQLVPLGDDPPDQRRVAACHPSEHEEGRPGAGAGEDVEQLVRVALDPPLERAPAGRSEARADVLGVEPVLDVERRQ
jgi:hypothetical protein